MSLEYIDEIPADMPDGKVLVHNRVMASPCIGHRGFRVWLATDPDEYEECGCWYAPQLAKHYRSAPAPYSPNKDETLLGRIWTAIGYAEGLTREECDGSDGETVAEIEEAVFEAFGI